MFFTLLNYQDAKNGDILATAVSAFTVPGNSVKLVGKQPGDMDSNIEECDKRSNKRKSYDVDLDCTADIYQLHELEHRAPNRDESTSFQDSNSNASLREELYDLVSSRVLEGFITFCIVANTVVMATEHYGMSSTLDSVISISNYVRK